jgi:hypothetical protein
MITRSPRRSRSAPWSVAFLTLIVAACAGAATSPPSSQEPASPAASAPASASPGPVIDTETLLRDASAWDGQRVRVDGFFLASADGAQLCSVVLESYPPQCGGATIRMTGAVPADVLAGLEQTTEPGLAQATWGWVVATGTFQASGADGRPTLEIEQIEVRAG